MKFIKYPFLFCFFFFFKQSILYSQITISLPYERMVFQRNNNQQGNILIAGNYYSRIDRVEARVIPIWNGSGVETGWTTIQNNPSNGYFKGSLFAQQGWYQLEVRGIANNAVVNTQAVQKVGIGEVFAIAGQSNAQGGASDGFGSVDDRVNTVKFSNDYSSYNKLPLGFSKLENGSPIAPFHYVPWAYGKLGDLLTARLNVPVLFYGAGHGGTESYWWGNSAEGQSFSAPNWVRQDLGAPYRALENSIAFYASLTGLRAILWHQGESDPFTAPNTYYDNIVKVINKSRQNTEHSNLAWVVSRASLNNWYSYHSNVIEGQNLLIQNYPNVFAGPNTDLYPDSQYRTDGIHMDTYTGLITLAQAWDSSLDNSFFSNSIPMFASNLLDLSVSCNQSNPTNPLTLVAPSGYQQYAWSNRQNTNAEAEGISNKCCPDYAYYFYPPAGYEAFNWQLDSTQSVSTNTGRYIMNARKTSRKTLFSPLMNITIASPPNVPTVTASATQIRPEDAVFMSSTACTNSWIVWSNGQTVNSFAISPASTTVFTSQCQNPYCLGLNSAPVTVVVSSCFPNALSLVGGIFSPEQPYQSQVSIQSIQKLQNTGKINYSAAQKIELLPGFESKTGSVFRATIGGCN